MATVYDQIKQGKLNKDDILSQNVEVLNNKFNIPPESAELSSGTITQTVTDSLEKMITVSDNYSALLLAEKVGLSAVTDFLITNGFTQSFVGINGNGPTTTPKDIGLFFEKLYSGQLVDADYSIQMLSLLKAQTINTKIPKYLPNTLEVAHKTGELNEYTHDSGIVYTDYGDYIIVVLSRSNDPIAAAERIAGVSKNVYQYFVSK
jgi:beta-lactamase class A